MSANPLPLSGIRVIEFTHAVMGPVAGHILAEMGAEVIRVEPAPHGDHTRRLKGFGAGYYTLFNRNKKSLAVNLKTDPGQQIGIKLIRTADVLIENFGPGTLERLGFGYPAVSKINPGLIYCSLKGFMKGPYEHRVALDEVVQMMSGLAYMTGPPGHPLRAGASIIDIMGGTMGALGVLLSLRERERTGRGGLIENGLFETAAFIMGQHMAYAAITQERVPPMPARVSAWAVYELFDTQDGHQIFIGITSDKHWKRFCQAFERPDLLADQSLATNNARIDARERLIPELKGLLANLSLEEIIRRSEDARIPFSPISRPEDLFEDPQLNQGDSLVSVKLSHGELTKLPRLPLALDGHRFDLSDPAPGIGDDTQQTLSELGYPEDEIAALREAEIIITSP